MSSSSPPSPGGGGGGGGGVGGSDGPKGFGTKTIGLLGGVCLLLNNITGSGMVLFPSLFQESGWLVVIIALVSICILSLLCSIMIIEAMASMPGNHSFEKRVEFTGCAYYYLGKKGYIITQIFFQLSLAFNNIGMIIQSTQVMDFAIAAIFGKSCAIPEFYPHFSFHCPPPVSGDITVFGNGVYVFSIGFLLTALLVTPLGFWNLDDNIIIQKISAFLVFAMVCTWCVLFSANGDLHSGRIPTVPYDLTNVMGVTIFNFAVITSIPSWVNEKRENVSILSTLLICMPMATVLFILIGVFGGLAYAPWFDSPTDSDATLLTKLQDSGNVVGKVTFYLFPVVVNLTSIPIMSIMQRYNLLESRVCGPRMANFFGVILPWLICIPFYTGSGFANVVNWGGLIANSVVNFIIPPLIYIHLIKKQKIAEKSIQFRNEQLWNQKRAQIQREKQQGLLENGNGTVHLDVNGTTDASTPNSNRSLSSSSSVDMAANHPPSVIALTTLRSKRPGEESEDEVECCTPAFMDVDLHKEKEKQQQQQHLNTQTHSDAATDHPTPGPASSSSSSSSSSGAAAAALHAHDPATAALFMSQEHLHEPRRRPSTFVPHVNKLHPNRHEEVIPVHTSTSEDSTQTIGASSTTTTRKGYSLVAPTPQTSETSSASLLSEGEKIQLADDGVDVRTDAEERDDEHFIGYDAYASAIDEDLSVFLAIAPWSVLPKRCSLCGLWKEKKEYRILMCFAIISVLSAASLIAIIFTIKQEAN